jgi:hypothetical protein
MSTFKNRFLEQFQKGWLAGSFGKAGWEDNAFSWASAKATAISQAAGTEVVNIGAITDDLAGTFRTEVTYGKMGATPFTSYNDAVKFSQRIPNSKVVESATGTPVTKGSVGYTYYVTAATPVEIVAGKTNELKESLSLFGRFFGSSSTIGNWFGTANRGIQDDLNNLAFQADFGGNKLQNFIQSELIPAYSKLNKENQGALTDIFHTMSDSKRTTWLDQAEFSHEYQAITGKMPSREVIQVYELTVEASDAAYYFKATEHLRAMNSKNTLMFDAKGKGFWEQVYPDKSARNTIGKVRNAKTGAVVDAHTLPPETVIYTYVEGKQGRVKSVYNVQGMTRLPTHSDALAYNAGGPRSNPYVTHFIGTVNDVNTATGKGSSWGTLIGAKSEKESISAVKEVNKIQSGASILKTKGITLDPANPYNGLTAAEGQALDNLVAANNTWMPQLTNWKDYVEFLSGRGVSLVSLWSGSVGTLSFLSSLIIKMTS